MNTAIENIRLYTGETYYDKGFVLIEGGTIAYAGDANGAAIPPDANRVDGRGDICMPGFYNAHCHAAMTLLRGVGSDLNLMDWLNQVMPIEDRMREKNGVHVYNGTRLAILEMIRRGVVAFADHYFCMDRVAEAVIESGIRANLSRGCTDKEGIHSAIELYNRYHNAAEKRVKVYMGLHAEYTTAPDIVEYAIEKAKELNTGLHVHISETINEVAGCVERHGVSPVKYFLDRGLYGVKTIAAHCVHVSEEDVEILAEHRVHAVHNPASNLKLANGFAPISKMIDRGVRVSLGTDGPSSNNGLDMLSDMRLASYMQKGCMADPTLMDAKKSLNMATREGALAMDFMDAGLLAPGMKADLILIDAHADSMTPLIDPLANVVYSAQGRDVTLTMVSGKILYRDGQFTSLEPEEIIRRANESARELMGNQ